MSGDGSAPAIAVLLRRLRASPSAAAEAEVLGRCEGAALAAALALGQQLGAPVCAIAMGPPRREDRVLAVALRAGCDRAVRVSDSALDGLDYLATARVLAAAIRHVGAELVLCGDRSQDELQGATGPAVAEILAIPHLTSVTDVRGADGELDVVQRGGGSVRGWQLRPPAVLCVASHRAIDGDGDTPEPSDEQAADEDTPTTAHRVRAIEELDLEKLDLDARELAYRARLLGRARRKRDGKKNALLLSTPGDLITRLVEDHLLV
jgi:electron transfer flavoprotein alpha/beta subunit